MPKLQMKESKNITRSIFLTILSQFPAHAFGIIAGIFITRILGPEGKGEYTMFYANTNLFQTIFGFSIINSIIFFTASKKISREKLKSIISILLLLTITLSIIFLGVWINSKYKDLLFSSNNYSFLLIILFLITILISQLNATFTAYFQGLRHFRIVNKILVLNGAYNCILFTCMYFLYRYDHYTFDLIDIVLVSVIILLLNTIHWYVYYLKHGIVKWNLNLNWKEDFSIFFKFTGLNHLSNILLFFNHRLILWVVAFYLDNWELGIFSLGMGLAQLLYLFSNPLTLLLESFLSSDKAENIGDLFSIFSRIQFTAILILCIIAALVSPFIIPFIYGSDFSHSVSILNVIMIGIILSCQSEIISSFFLANNQLKYNVISSSIGICITIITAPLLIKEYQLIGAAFSQILTYLGIFIYLLISVRIKGGIDNNLFFITRSDIKFIKTQLQIARRKK
jgi:O-antigen/teichoic acid export membrane protein